MAAMISELLSDSARPKDQPLVLASVDLSVYRSGNRFSGSTLNVTKPGREKASLSSGWLAGISLRSAASEPAWQDAKMKLALLAKLVMAVC